MPYSSACTVDLLRFALMRRCRFKSSPEFASKNHAYILTDRQWNDGAHTRLLGYKSVLILTSSRAMFPVRSFFGPWSHAATLHAWAVKRRLPRLERDACGKTIHTLHASIAKKNSIDLLFLLRAVRNAHISLGEPHISIPSLTFPTYSHTICMR